MRVALFGAEGKFKMAYPPTTNQITRSSGRALNVMLWTSQVLTAAAFLAAGGSGLAGATPIVAMFDEIGLGQWFRYLAAILEIAGAIAVVTPRTAFYGAALLATVMFGALIAHLAVLGMATAMPSFILLVLTGTIAYFRRARS